MRAFAIVLLFGLMSGLVLAQSPTGFIAGSGNFFSPIVSDLDKAAAFYGDGLGLDLQASPDNAEDNLGLRNMFGLPDAQIRWTIARPPESRTGVEIVEISAANGKPLERRMQDPGAFTLIVFVRDLDATLERVQRLGAPVVSEGGVPMTLPFGEQGARVVVVMDPDGHFVELVQPEQMPETAAPMSANVVDVRIRLTVDDVEESLRLYRDALGLEVLNSPEWVDNSVVSAALGVSGAQYRVGVMQIPNSELIFEVIDFNGIDRRQISGNIQDPGSTRVQFQTRDLDSTLETFKSFGGEVISTDGVAAEISIPGGALKVAIVREPDNLFIVLLPAPPA